ncbi:MAG: hypothetical protein K2Y03_03535 [Sphingomonas sp.]|nr:hypothetical protein [Sphingomonas sp.]
MEASQGMEAARPPDSANALYRRVRGLHDLSSAILVLAENASDRMTLPQAVFFLAAAAADMAGKPETYTEIKEAVGPIINRSLHSTYKVFLEEHEVSEGSRQAALGWLYRETDRRDQRRKYLRLTSEGRAVISALLEGFRPTGRHPHQSTEED